MQALTIDCLCLSFKVIHYYKHSESVCEGVLSICLYTHSAGRSVDLDAQCTNPFKVVSHLSHLNKHMYYRKNVHKNDVNLT